jgi:hypothetical protein
MDGEKKDKRRYKRYNTEAKIYFDFAYDLETKVEFELIKEDKKPGSKKKYLAVSRNISAEGLCFVSHKNVQEGDLLYMEVYLPNAVEPIHMTGKVKWCDAVSESSTYVLGDKKNKQMYHIGIILSHVNGESVHDSIHFDKEYGVNWSVVLESVFGSYKMLMGEKYKRKSK